jgi:hypothetical protein
MPKQKIASKGLAAIQAASSKPGKVAGQTVQRLYVPASELEAFAAAFEAAFPKATPHARLIDRRDLAPDGETPLVSYAMTQRQPGGTVVIYYSGNGSLSGEFSTFQWPVPVKVTKPRARKPKPATQPADLTPA